MTSAKVDSGTVPVEPVAVVPTSESGCCSLLRGLRVARRIGHPGGIRTFAHDCTHGVPVVCFALFYLSFPEIG